MVHIVLMIISEQNLFQFPWFALNSNIYIKISYVCILYVQYPVYILCFPFILIGKIASMVSVVLMQIFEEM